MDQHTTVIAISHLRWNSVFQRPHHLLSRLANSQRVLFIEEPVFDERTTGHWEYKSPTAGLIVCVPHSPVSEPGFCETQLEILRSMMPSLRNELHVTNHLAWLYTPLASPLLAQLDPQVVIYDCMDALDAFLNAPQLLRQREDELLARADLAFAGGPSLFRRLGSRHANAHCFPSSVDPMHFARANGGCPEPENQASLARPRLGFFGVIDERIDLKLLAAMATSHPEWQIVMVGPVVKISSDVLPRHPNIHYLGQQNYSDLPGYVGGWDVCLMPFARNEATRYISPTKVLEYMAAERPIVSTRITDVADPYGHIVFLADDSDAFVAACEEALGATKQEREERTALMRRVIGSTSWDLTIHQMRELISDCLSAKSADSSPSASHSGASNGRGKIAARPRLSSTVDRTSSLPKTPSTVVIGAGPTGLSAAYHLGKEAVLLEQNKQIGGWCRSIEEKGFTFDFAGHIMFSNDPYVHKMYEMLLGDNVHWQDREAWIYSKNVYTRYPFQGALYGLPADVVKECIMGAIEARFGSQSAHPQPASNGHSPVGSNGNSPRAATNGNGHCPKVVTDCCADGLLESTAKLVNGNGNGKHLSNGQNGVAKSESFEEFIYRVWGAGIAKHFAIPYNKKLWAVPLSEIETSWLGGRVPMPDLEEILDGALKPVGKPMGPNARFGYPLRGGFQALMNGFLPHVQDQLHLEARVAQVSPSQQIVRLHDGTIIPYTHLISTMPLPVLVKCMGDEAPPSVRQAASRLRYVSVRCVHLGIGRENLTDKHWIYYPEDTVFHRIFVQGNASPHCNPQGGFGLTCEITYSEYKPLPCGGDELIDLAISDCHNVGVFAPDDVVLASKQVDMPFAYVVYDHERPKNVKLIRDWLATKNIVLAGRYSEWEYYNSDHAFIAGKRAAEKVQAQEQTTSLQPIFTSSTVASSVTLSMSKMES